MFELVEVKRQRCWRKPQPFAYLPRRKPFGSGLHEQPKNIETRLMTERDKSGYRFILFHYSNIMEILAEIKAPGKARYEELRSDAPTVDQRHGEPLPWYWSTPAGTGPARRFRHIWR